MRMAQDFMGHFIRRGTVWTWTVGLMLAPLTLGLSGPAQGAEDFFESLAIQRPANPGLAPDLALPSVEGETVHLKNFRGRIVLLGFFTTA